MSFEEELGTFTFLDRIGLGHQGFKIRIRQYSGFTGTRRCKDLVAAPAERDLIRLIVLLMIRYRCRLRGRQDVDMVSLEVPEERPGSVFSELSSFGDPGKIAYLVTHDEALPVGGPRKTKGSP